MAKTTLRFMALSAFFVASLLFLVACGGSSGNDIPGNAVASVDGTAITKAEYTHWAAITAKSAAQQGGTVVIPDPPAYTKCVAALRKAAPKPKKGASGPSVTALKAQCKQRDTQLVQQTMQSLIQNAWIEGEAEKQGVKATDADVEKQLKTTKKQSFPTEKAFQKFLKQSGMTMDDIRDRLRVQVLVTKLTKKIQDSAAPVTDKQVSDYYNKNKSQFALPERRDLEIILTKTEAKANEAKAAIEGGMSWKDAASKYSVDTLSKSTGGQLKGVAKGQQDKALDTAAFNAQKGKIAGPVKGQFGWYLVRVTKITPAKQNSFAESKAQIKQQLVQQGQQQKLQTFGTDFQKRWKDDTNCRKGYVVPLCSNAPTPKATSTAGGTVAGQGSK